MSDLTHLFKVGQKVKLLVDDFDCKKHFCDGVVKEIYPDHIIITNTELEVDGWYEENFNIETVYPDYNFYQNRLQVLS